MKVDIGCGYNKQPGYIGMDRYETPDVKIVCDFDKEIPLEDNSVERVIMSHSIEHCDDIMHTMKELYRVCKHKAIVCMTAPYYNTGVNLANPYHKQVLNEHTPRFFTTSDYTPLPPEDYVMPHAATWGLGESDNSNLQMDFRCVRMEFFYYPEYRKLSLEEKREARKKYADVVDQIMYHFVVVKEPITTEELDEIGKGYLEEPLCVTIRKKTEAYEDLDVIAQQKEINHLKLIETLQTQVKLKDEAIEELQMALAEARKLYEQNRNKYERVSLQVDRINRELRVQERIQEKESAKYENERKAQELAYKELKEEKEEAVHQYLEFYEKKQQQAQVAEAQISALTQETTLIDSSKCARIKRRLAHIKNKKATDLLPLVNTLARQMIDANISQSQKDLGAYALELTPVIGYQEIVYYPFKVLANYLNSIEVIFSNPTQFTQSEEVLLGVELLDEAGNIIETKWLKNKEINHNVPTKMQFKALFNTKDKIYTIRFVGTKPENSSVRLYEWVNYGMTGKVKDKWFCGKIN